MYLAQSSNNPNDSQLSTKTPFKKKALKSFMSDLGTPGRTGGDGFQNPIFGLQDKYLKELEENYEFMQNTKKAKKY